MFRNCALYVILSLAETVYIWPDINEQQETARRIASTYFFPNCVKMIDGTLLPLSFKPSTDGETYFSRKKNYSLQMLIVCDDTCRINYYHCGWPGSVHNNHVWKTCPLAVCPESYSFATNQYLLGDSAFQGTSLIVPAYKTANGLSRIPNESSFNTLLLSPQVKSEHCIGLLKGSFPWLKDIRILISSALDLQKICKYVRAAVILHNLLIQAPYKNDSID